MRPLDLAERLAAVVATQQEIAKSKLDPAEVMDRVLRHAQELTRAAGAVVETLDGDELVFRAASGIAEAHVGHRLRVDSSLTGRAIRTGEVVKCDNAELDPYVDHQAARKIGVSSLIVAPLKYEGKIIGALAVVSPVANAFSDLDAYSLQLLAGLIAAALQHASDFEERRASEERYRLLFERNLAGAFRTTLDGRILDCNDSLARILGYDSKEDLASRRTWEFYPQASDREAYIAELRQKKALTNSRLRLKKKNGQIIETVVNANIVPGPKGETYVLGTLLEAPQRRPRAGAMKSARRNARASRRQA